jgi:hypothetical protein
MCGSALLLYQEAIVEHTPKEELLTIYLHRAYILRQHKRTGLQYLLMDRTTIRNAYHVAPYSHT